MMMKEGGGRVDKGGTGEGDSEYWMWDTVGAPLEVVLTSCKVFEGGAGYWNVD